MKLAAIVISMVLFIAMMGGALLGMFTEPDVW